MQSLQGTPSTFKYQNPSENLRKFSWEEELTIDELKTHQRERPVLRSQTAIGVLQEIHGLLLGHYAVRVLMEEAAARKRIDPQRISFTATLNILRCRLPECPKSRCGLRKWYKALIEEISEEILPDRRNQINPRVIKKKDPCQNMWVD